MRRRPVIGVAVAVFAAATLTACVHGSTTITDTTDATTQTLTQSAQSTAPTGPVDTRKVVASDAPACPLLSAVQAADIGGMRLARIQVLKQGTSVVGCRFYAIQGSSLAESEHLPGPNQPVIEILATRYPSELAAHNALAVAATKGTDQNQYDVAKGVVGVAYRIDFDPADKGQDWAFGFNKGSTLVVVRTATTVTSVNALDLAQAVYPRF